MLSIKTKVYFIPFDKILSAIIILGLKVNSLQSHSVLYDCKVTNKSPSAEKGTIEVTARKVTDSWAKGT